MQAEGFQLARQEIDFLCLTLQL